MAQLSSAIAFLPQAPSLRRAGRIWFVFSSTESTDLGCDIQARAPRTPQTRRWKGFSPGIFL